MTPAVSAVTVSTCANGSPSGGRSGMPTNPRIVGLTNTMYAIVSQVVIPAMISMRTDDPRSEILKNPSSPPAGAASTRTTSPGSASALPVSVSAMATPSGPAPRPSRDRGRQPKHRNRPGAAASTTLGQRARAANRFLLVSLVAARGRSQHGEPNIEAASDQGRTQGGGQARACRAPAQDGAEQAHPADLDRARGRARGRGERLLRFQAQAGRGGPPAAAGRRPPGHRGGRVRRGRGRRALPAEGPGPRPRPHADPALPVRLGAARLRPAQPDPAPGGG